MAPNSSFDFPTRIEEAGLTLSPLALDTLQVNVTKLCNQACHHCHVDASPKRTEQMDRTIVDQCLHVLAEHKTIKNLDLTGGAPELNPHFDDFVTKARVLNKHVSVRHNLTVTLDGNPQTHEDKHYLPDFFARHHVEVISSLPYYQSYFTDRQRGQGVFEKSIESLRRLNAVGYGKDPELVLNLVYNPVGAYLPASQVSLEHEFKNELLSRYGITFNGLHTITNMPIHRFRDQLIRMDQYDDYMQRLHDCFNPSAAMRVMCRSLLSVGYDGTLYDCDFNQMLDIRLTRPMSIFDFDLKILLDRKISFASHCFGCTAGAGSSCGGQTVR